MSGPRHDTRHQAPPSAGAPRVSPSGFRSLAQAGWQHEIRAAHRARVDAEQPSDSAWTRLRARAEARLIRRRRVVASFAALSGLAFAAVAVVVALGVGSEAGVGAWAGGEGGLSLRLAGGHQVAIAPAATLRIDETSATRLRAEVARGRVAFDVAPRREGDLFRVDFARHHLEVRGTAFEVEVAGSGEAVVVVSHGVVDVYRDHSALIRLRQGDRWTSEARAPEPTLTVAPTAGTEAIGAPSGPAAAIGPSSPSASSKPVEVADGPPPETVAAAPTEARPMAAQPAAVPMHPPREVAQPAPAPFVKRASDAAPRAPHVVEREVRIEGPPPVAAEPLSPSVESALLASLRIGDCVRAEKALAAIVRAHGPATPGEVWWMRAWCARRGGDLARSRRWFALASGRVEWSTPAGDELPPLP